MEVSYSRNSKLIRRKFYQYLIPTVLMVIAMQFGSLADGIVIGNMLGDEALSASSLALPAVFITQLPAMWIGVGASIVGANYLGKRMVKEASKVFKIALILAFTISLIFIPLGLFAAGPIATFFAGNFQNLAPMISQYMQVFAYQAPIFGITFVIAYFLPSDSSPTLGAVYFFITNVVHIAVEVLFCATLDRSVAMYGVAASTGIGLLAGLVVLIPYIKSKKRAIDLTCPIKGALRFAPEIFKAGSSTSALVGLSFVYCLALNLAATAYLKDTEIPLFAMLSNFSFVIDLFVLGILQIMPSVISSLFGEKDYFSVRKVARWVFIIAMVVTVTLTAISMIFPEVFFHLFGVDLSTVGIVGGSVAEGITDPLLVVRLYCISFLLYAANKYLNSYYPSILVNVPPVVGNIVRIGLIGPVTIYFLMMHLGVIGFSYGVIIMEAAALVITIAVVLIGRKIGKLHGSPILLLPNERKEDQCLDISIPAKEEEISKAVEELQRYTQEKYHDEKSAAMLAIATEEIIANTIAHGYRRRTGVQYIDINVSKIEDQDRLLVRIRDDGVTFDPTTFVSGEDEEMQYHGIEVVKKVASDFKYLRVLNTNNTIMEIQLTPQERNQNNGN